MIFNLIFGLLAVFISYRLYVYVLGYFEYKRHVAAGIVFPNGFSYLNDLIDLTEVIKKEPTCINWGSALRKRMGVE
jgi:hypothetical protein